MAIQLRLGYCVLLQRRWVEMRKTLEDLYYGNITPCEQQMIPGSELKRAVDRVAKYENQLMEQIGETEIGRASCRERV